MFIMFTTCHYQSLLAVLPPSPQYLALQSVSTLSMSMRMVQLAEGDNEGIVVVPNNIQDLNCESR